jgi:hypothetical protein
VVSRNKRGVMALVPIAVVRELAVDTPGWLTVVAVTRQWTALGMIRPRETFSLLTPHAPPAAEAAARRAVRASKT